MTRSPVSNNLLFLLIAFVGSVFGNSKSDADKLWGHVNLGETEPAFWHLAKMYQDRGAVIASDGNWKLKLKVNDFKEIINRYSNGNVQIEVSRMVKPSEARAYWDNWSKVLTADNFDQDKFFRDDNERFILANFNVLVLSAHEIGHYLDFVYKMSDRDYGGGFLKDNDPMNCSEGYADRIAVATINELSTDKRFAELRERYVELINTFNASIPVANRYNFDSIDYATSKCGEIDLMKNGVNDDGKTVNENFFRQYSSAYFNRHALMLSDREFGNISRMFGRDLFGPFFRRIDFLERPFVLSTMSTMERISPREIFLGGDELRSEIYFQRQLTADFELNEEPVPTKKTIKDPFINPAGKIGQLELEWEYNRPTVELEEFVFRERSFKLRLNTGDTTDTSEMTVKVPSLPAGGYNFSAHLMPTSSTFILVLTPFDVDKRYDHLLLVRGIRKRTGWTFRTSRLKIDDVSNNDEIGGNWFVTETGRVRVVRVERQKKEPAAKMTVYELDPEKASVRLIKKAIEVDATEGDSSTPMKNGLWRNFSWFDGVFGNDQGELFIFGQENDLQLGSAPGIFLMEKKPRLLVGYLSGIRDGNNAQSALISDVRSPRFVSEGELVFIDTFVRQSYLRQLKF